MLGHIETALAGVRVACAELRTGAVATGEKLDRAMATLKSNSERIDAIQVRQGQIEHYLRRARSCTKLKIIGIPSAVVSSPGTDIHQLCVSVLELFAADHTSDDIQEVRWLYPPISRRAAGASGAPFPATRTLVVQYKQAVTRDHVLKLKKRHGNLLASRLFPGASGALKRSPYWCQGPIEHTQPRCAVSC
ncbi:hypothetical protein TKK_0007790 [Trichogramma kaykai]